MRRVSAATGTHSLSGLWWAYLMGWIGVGPYDAGGNDQTAITQHSQNMSTA